MTIYREVYFSIPWRYRSERNGVWRREAPIESLRDTFPGACFALVPSLAEGDGGEGKGYFIAIVGPHGNEKASATYLRKQGAEAAYKQLYKQPPRRSNRRSRALQAKERSTFPAGASTVFRGVLSLAACRGQACDYDERQLGGRSVGDARLGVRESLMILRCHLRISTEHEELLRTLTSSCT
jgi:hypothetical protein